MNHFKQYLDIQNPKRISFITNKRINDDELSIDHVIPWSFMYSDDLWNLVYVEKFKNSSKGNRIPSEKMIRKLETRNRVLLKDMDEKRTKNKHVDELRLSIENHYVRKFWIGCKG